MLLSFPPFPPHQAEVDVNISVDVSSLVSSADLPLREAGAGAEDGRERFYLTTAINYTNGTHGLLWFAKNPVSGAATHECASHRRTQRSALYDDCRPVVRSKSCVPAFDFFLWS